MPILNAAPVEATVPGQARRRVWVHPELRSHSLLVLTPDRLYLAPLSGCPKPETVAAVEAGIDLDDHLGSLATVVDLATVRRARLDLLSNSLVVEYVCGRLGKSQMTVVFATPEAADACFTKVWRRLGGGFELLPYKRDSWALARTPLTALGAILAITAALGLSLNISEDFATARAVATLNVPGAGESGTSVQLPKSPPEALLGWLDWRVVCGVGGVAAAVVQVWLYRRLSQPPESLEVMRT
ncbi:MAG: hypothetical protein JWO38_7979 [Gemmataceae bacterium]|nr:hypothetical protein [Gemmataceae bacterium]